MSFCQDCGKPATHHTVLILQLMVARLDPETDEPAELTAMSRTSALVSSERTYCDDCVPTEDELDDPMPLDDQPGN